MGNSLNKRNSGKMIAVRALLNMHVVKKRQDRQGVMTDPKRNTVQPQDGDHLMSGSDGEEGHVEEADQVRNTDVSVKEAEPVLRRSTRNRRPPTDTGTH